MSLKILGFTVRLAQWSTTGVYFLMPLKDGVVTWVQGKRVDLLSVLQAHAQEADQEYAIQLGAGKQITCRLFARRATEAQVKRRHAKQDAYARKHGTTVTQRQRTCLAWPKPLCCCGCAGKSSWCGNSGKCKGK